MRFLYVHGFASSPHSRKARIFQAALAAQGVNLIVPALDEGDFEHLTISGQIAVMERALEGQAARLIGSSMGGYLSGLYAASHPEVDRLVLMAPAFGFAPRWRDRVIPGQDLDVFHYGTGAMRRVHYGLIEDAVRFPDAPDFSQPCRIFHGVNDDVVPVEYSRSFARLHPNAELTELDSDHELLDVLPRIIDESVPWLL
jgi:pimeloyl-ACP methyl ester carboxylesterase